MLKIFAAYAVIVNLTGFVMFGCDKHFAVNHEWRISEASLIGIAVTGGSAGAIAGMLFFHHKTKHTKFCIGLPVILMIQIILVFCCSRFCT